MSSEVLTQTIAAGATATFGRGRIFNLLAASFPVSVVAEVRAQAGGQTLQRVFNNIPPGSKFVAKEGHEWTYLRVTSVNAQAITMFVGDEDMSFNNAVTVTGTALVAINPSSTLNDTVDTVQAFGTQTVIPANVSRRRITIGVRTTNPDSVRVSSAGGAGRGVEIQPGTYIEFDTTGSMTVRNDNAAGNATWYALEEV